MLCRRNYVTMENMNKNLIKAEYQVRGTVVIKSSEIQESLSKGNSSYPFDKLTLLNIGNPQALNQLPMTFPREVIASFLSNFSNNKDAVLRANQYKNELDSTGNYTQFCGLNLIRKNIAKFISSRDRIDDISYKDIILTNGAGGAIKTVFDSIINSDTDAVMTPIPQYPLYSALIQLLNSNLIGYELNEQRGWCLDLENIRQQYQSAYDRGLSPKIFVIINPGNPTGNVLSKQNIEEIVKFCYDHKMVIIADEVYQNNIYDEDLRFISVRRTVKHMPYPYCKTIIFSCNSVSKGYYGECGLRGGYLDIYNAPELIRDTILNSKCFEICPNIVGQLSMDLLINPPTSYNASQSTINLYNDEKLSNFNNLKLKAELMHDILNEIPRFKCKKIEGAMYAFPSINIPTFRIEEAKKKNVEPDMLFALSLLEETGIVCVPGSGFGQKKGTYHIRLTNLINPASEIERMLGKLKDFSNKYFNN